MSLYKDGCGHPLEWNMRLVNNGRTYTYCMGCIVEKLSLDNLEDYSNPFVTLNEVGEAPEPFVMDEKALLKKTNAKK